MNERDHRRAQPRADVLKFGEQIERQEPLIAMALPTRPDGTQLITVSRFMRALITTVSMTPRLLRADRRSFWDAVSRCASDGLLPDGKEAALVPFTNRRKDESGLWSEMLIVQYMPMIGGYRRLVREAGIDWQLRIVHEKDQFSYVLGDNERIEHIPSNEDDPGPWIHVYAIAKDRRTSDIIARDVMNRSAVFRIRDRSEGWKSMMRLDKKEREKSMVKSAWMVWEEEMALKTVAKKQVKVLPLSTDSTIYDVMRREEARERGQDTIRTPITSTGSLSEKMRALADQSEQAAKADEDDDIQDIDEDGDVIDKQTGEITKTEPATETQPASVAAAPEAQASSSSQQAVTPAASGAPAPEHIKAAPQTVHEAEPKSAGPVLKLTEPQAAKIRKFSELLMGAQSQRTVSKGATNFLADESYPEGSAAEAAVIAIRDAHLARVAGKSSPAECDMVRDRVTRI